MLAMSGAHGVTNACMQAVSSRPDVAPPSYIRELEKLQDQIPPFPNADAMAVIEQDTGQPIVSLFSYISPEPVAAASLGQVLLQHESLVYLSCPLRDNPLHLNLQPCSTLWCISYAAPGSPVMQC